MAKFQSFVQNLLPYFRQGSKYAAGPVVLGLTAALEEVVEVLTFNCPCDTKWSSWYGWLYILAPAWIFLVIGILCTCLAERVFLMKEQKEKKETAEGNTQTVRAKIEIAPAKYCSARKCFKALIVPCAWIFVTLIDGHYYSCAQSVDPCGLGTILVENYTIADLENITDESSYKPTSYNLNLEKYSKIWAWIFIIAVSAIALIVIWVVRCCEKSITPLNYYTQVYCRSEEKCLAKMSKEKAKALAAKNVDYFLGIKCIHKKDWMAVSTDPTDIPDSADSELLVYSPLHKVVMDHETAVEETQATH